MRMRRIGFFLNVVAMGLLFPGIFLPMFRVHLEVAAGVNGANVKVNVLEKELSIIGTVADLWENDRLLVSFLIALFSIGVPLLKGILVAVVGMSKNKRVQDRVNLVLHGVSKWSMADVFVVAVFLAYLSTTHADNMSEQSLTVFGFVLKVLVSTQMESLLRDGFYYFLGYCLLSLLGVTLVGWERRKPPPEGSITL